MALVDRDDFWTEEGVVKGRDEEERLLDLVESVVYVTSFFEFSHVIETSLTVVDVWQFSASPEFSAFLCEIAVWLLL